MEPTLTTAGENTSNQKSTTTDSTHLSSADADLRELVEELLNKDQRFKGMSRYVNAVKFWWSNSISTACAGHGFIFFNPDFWDKLAVEERKTVVAHEIWHLILKHLERGKDFDPESYNIAADHVINNGCKQDGFHTDTDLTNFGENGILCDPRFTNMSTNQVYAVVHKERKKDPDSHGPSNAPSKSDIEDLVKQALEGTGTDIEEQAQMNDKLVDDAQDNAKKSIGSQPGGTVSILEAEGIRVFVIKATYEEIFKDYLTDPLTQGKRTHMRPSRRQMDNGLRLKGRLPKPKEKNRLKHLVYALDVSGSITSHQARQFLRSAKTLKELLKPKQMTIILWDTRIVFERCFQESETLDNIQIQAGGGTSLHPVYKRVEEINPEALVIFTDLAVSIPPKPTWETIWIVPEQPYQGYLDAVNYGNVYMIPEK